MISVIHTVQTHIGTLLLAVHVLGRKKTFISSLCLGQGIPQLVILRRFDKLSHEVVSLVK
jgi:hypothetical protein